jgi:hypothetical protein
MMKRLAILSLLLCSATADAKSVFHDAPPLAEPLELQQPLTVSEITSDTDLLLDPAGIIEIGKSIYAGGAESLCIYVDSDNDTGICGAANQDERLEFWYGNNGLFYLVDLSGTPVLRQFSGSGPAIAWRDPDGGPVFIPDAQHGLNVHGFSGDGLGTGTKATIWAASAVQVAVSGTEVVITPTHTGLASMKQTGSTIVTINTVNVWEEVDGFSVGHVNGWTFGGGGDLTAGTGYAGTYVAHFNISADSAVAIKDFETGLSIDDGTPDCVASRTAANVTTGNWGMPCTLTIAEGDVVKMEVRNVSDANNITVIHAWVVMHKL